MNRLSLIALALSFGLAGAAHAASGDIDAGKKKSQSCQACHGTDGNATDPQYPRLAGQYRDYLQQALKEYKTGKRKNPIMAGFAGPLSDQDMADLAAYFASLPGKIEDLSGHLQGQ
jgi:cytochrome c553